MKESKDTFTRVIYALIIGLFIAIVYYLVIFILAGIFNFNKANWLESLFFGMLFSFMFEFLNPKFKSYIKKRFGTK